MSLSAFLAENAVPVENIKFVASKRFLGEDGNPIPWEIKTITGTEDEALRKSCAKRVLVPGKKNQYHYCLHELHLTPSAFYALPRRERAFIIAAIDVRVEAEKKKQKEIERKQRRGRHH